MTLVESIKARRHISTTAYDAQIVELIEEAKADLGLVGNTRAEDEQDPNIRAYIVAYALMRMNPERDEYERLDKWCKAHKSTMMHRTGYTNWEGTSHA